MREQSFNKIKKTVFILLAVFLVVSLTAASASACDSKTSNDKCKSSLNEKVAKEKVVKEVAKEKVAKEKVVKEVAKEKKAKEKVVKEVAKEKVGNELSDVVENDWFDSGWDGFDCGCRDDFCEESKIKFFNIRGCVAESSDKGFDGWWD
ncbi:hypothetical protein [Methanosarcina sp.]|uniref:hypothetical protein n=1 Tax=Methanosarcina sp. TaxID=2213 RepID=UPI003C71E167